MHIRGNIDMYTYFVSSFYRSRAAFQFHRETIAPRRGEVGVMIRTAELVARRACFRDEFPFLTSAPRHRVPERTPPLEYAKHYHLGRFGERRVVATHKYGRGTLLGIHNQQVGRPTPSLFNKSAVPAQTSILPTTFVLEKQIRAKKRMKHTQRHRRLAGL
ncbi:uncharacterized protein LOC124176382 [Neodiprion fabricii]|uniref:uncharacterized protein LOC124176382 n=1 Tax=Neodiprion fabricii TaxID=2872261 RepID=UPI001ED8CD5E|nr:uncharacterized protein LOC124176382 [Neodiprion fabricii]